MRAKKDLYDQPTPESIASEKAAWEASLWTKRNLTQVKGKKVSYRCYHCGYPLDLQNAQPMECPNHKGSYKAVEWTRRMTYSWVYISKMKDPDTEIEFFDETLWTGVSQVDMLQTLKCARRWRDPSTHGMRQVLDGRDGPLPGPTLFGRRENMKDISE